ncbi:methyltransferase domain-containing protein [Paenibacillus sp. LHD-38]|uniref:class I SAM-dependent methyltransferase n=1 Tax=Paenibacillus sp. LHD-38 TaxID=3072143 RepID=UPI00280CC424|nr:methyltransferase domain-containing protein [Paenibacillus sp. LHD-38]MDQ8738723.1 methyltransferase domain-containing protein [Paenibacillus sp. LHD-38]
MSVKSEIVLNRDLLAGAAYFFGRENGLNRRNRKQPTEAIKATLISKGVLSSDLKLLDKEFGYACYEHYRQVYEPDSFDLLLQQEASNRKRILDLCCGAGATIFSLLESKPDIIYGFDANASQIELLETLLLEQNNRSSTVIAKAADVHRIPLADHSVELLLEQSNRSCTVIAKVADAHRIPLADHSVKLLLEQSNRSCTVITKAADAHQIPLADHSVDFVVCRVALQYLNVEQALEEMYRVLSPGGKVFLLVHGSGYIGNYLFSRKGIFSKKVVQFFRNKLLRSHTADPTFHRSQANFFRKKQLIRLMEAQGFQAAQLHTFTDSLTLGMLPVYFAVTAER